MEVESIAEENDPGSDGEVRCFCNDKLRGLGRLERWCNARCVQVGSIWSV